MKKRHSIPVVVIIALVASCQTQQPSMVLTAEIADLNRANRIYAEFGGERTSSRDAETVTSWVSLFQDLNDGWVELPHGPNRPWDARFLFSMHSMLLTGFWIYDDTLVTQWGEKHFQKKLNGTELQRLQEQFKRTEPSPGAYSSKAADGLTGNAQE